MRTMLSFTTVETLIRALAATMRGTTYDFERAVDALIEGSGWTPAEFFAVRRGDVIVIDAVDGGLT